MKNHLEVRKGEFRSSMRIFTRKHLRLETALLAYEQGFLSIQSGEVTIVMNARGEWQGRASFNPLVLRALAEVPPIDDPVVFVYQAGKLHIGSLSVGCEWQAASQAFIENIEHPGILDLLALDRTLPRSEVASTGLGQKIGGARNAMERKIKSASKQLAELEVSELTIRGLIEERIQARLLKSGSDTQIIGT